MVTEKIFNISKDAFEESYRKVRSKGGAAGVDGESLKVFSANKDRNLYKLWNRMSSGSYMPPAVLLAEIPKSDGKVRRLGIPTVADRVAQGVVRAHLEPALESIFHEDSYGYRPNRSAHDALAKTRQRCFKYHWAIDIDIKGFFDNISHDLMMKAVKHHTDERWMLICIERWLKAPMQTKEGTVEAREKGTPQGGVISPLLANLFLHYAFDNWMDNHYPQSPFERYADDIVVHCRSEAEAKWLKQQIEERMRSCQLELHPGKTKIVYCKKDGREDDYPDTSFDFLGYTFRPRLARTRRGEYFVGFLPAISTKAEKAIRQKIRNWNLTQRLDMTLEDIAREYNRVIHGWVNYYGKFFKSSLSKLFGYLNRVLLKWAKRKHKRLRYNKKKAMLWLCKLMKERPCMFTHWMAGCLRISE